MTRPAEIVLVLNAGSSSLKFAAFGLPGLEFLIRGEFAGAPTTRNARMKVRAVLRELAASSPRPVGAVGHRLVHGGPALLRHCRVNASIRARLEAAVPFAPLHAPAELALLAAVERELPGVPNFACFDTAFFSRLPAVSRRLPLAAPLLRGGVHRYGFHGLSCESVLRSIGPHRLGRAVIAHLGSGCSLTAVRNGRPCDTSMGFSPAGGVMMATRPGDVDPGTILYWLRRSRRGADELEKLIYHHSGARAIGGTGDFRKLLSARGRSPRARLAVQMFVYSIRQKIGALAATLGGIDDLVFTGGVGAHSAILREEICSDLDFLGIRLDRRRNARSARIISRPAAPCRVWVMSADEEGAIARHVRRLMA